MPAAGRRPVPRDFVVAGIWPDARLAGDDERLVAAAGVAQQLARNVRAAVEGQSLRAVSHRAGLSHQIILGLLAGDRWVEVLAVAKLERALGADIWPRRDPGGPAARH